MAWRRCIALFAFVLGLLLVAEGARAADAAPSAGSAEARREAARKFAEGTRAFDAGDFTRAGQAYEAAYGLAPHEDPLWNAARAWHRAGELAHAANLYARYLREAPAGASDRASATAALGQLARKLARIEIHVEAGVEDARLDGAPIDAPAVYVVPGDHVVRGRTPSGDVESRQTLEAGATVSVSLAATGAGGAGTNGPPPIAAPPPPPPPEHALAERRSERAGWSPVVVVVEGAVTLAVAGVAVWSGLDTLSTLDEFDAAPTQARLETGRDQQTRTNVLIGASIALGVITAATALCLVDWGHGRVLRVGVGPASAAASGSF